jgi:tRNA dimethylallyltransferase
VGGTGLYLKALAHGICKAAPGDAGTRHQLQLELQEHGLALLHRELQKVDPVLASRVQPQDRQRILRALEVFRSTGQPLSKWQAHHGFRSIRYRTIKIFLNRPREELYARINQRVEAMMFQGFLDEVRSLLERGYGPELKSMQALGYRHLAAYLAGKLALNDAVEGIRRDTRRYAKRQLTWFRADPEYAWLAADQPEEVVRFVDHALADIRPSAAG